MFSDLGDRMEVLWRDVCRGVSLASARPAADMDMLERYASVGCGEAQYCLAMIWLWTGSREGEDVLRMLRRAHARGYVAAAIPLAIEEHLSGAKPEAVETILGTLGTVKGGLGDQPVPKAIERFVGASAWLERRELFVSRVGDAWRTLMVLMLAAHHEEDRDRFEKLVGRIASAALAQASSPVPASHPLLHRIRRFMVWAAEARRSEAAMRVLSERSPTEREREKWARRAHDEGTASGAETLMRFLARTPGRSVERWDVTEEAALLGGHEAIVTMGNACTGVLADGVGFCGPLSDREAVSWFTRGAAMGSPECVARLAWMHELGRGVPRNVDAAARMYADVLRTLDGATAMATRIADMRALGSLPKSPSHVLGMRRRLLDEGIPSRVVNLALSIPPVLSVACSLFEGSCVGPRGRRPSELGPP